MKSNDDSRVIDSVLAGNSEEFAILVDRYKGLVYTIAYRILNNREDAQEAAQDAFVKAYRSLAGFRKDSGFSTWLYRIAYNTAVSKKRLKKPAFQNIDDIPSVKEHTDIPKYDFDALSEKEHILESAMKRIPEEDRVLITLYYLDESNVDEIHTITGLSKSNVKVKLFRARKRLQDLISNMTEKSYY